MGSTVTSVVPPPRSRFAFTLTAMRGLAQEDCGAGGLRWGAGCWTGVRLSVGLGAERAEDELSGSVAATCCCPVSAVPGCCGEAPCARLPTSGPCV